MKSQGSGRVVIGMDPHKRSVTIEVMTDDESVVGGGRFSTDATGYRTMLDAVSRLATSGVAAGCGCGAAGTVRPPSSSSLRRPAAPAPPATPS